MKKMRIGCVVLVAVLAVAAQACGPRPRAGDLFGNVLQITPASSLDIHMRGEGAEPGQADYLAIPTIHQN
jgi:hypothetical protein